MKRDAISFEDGTLQTVVVATRVLDALAESRQAIGVTELARRLGEPKARVHRHLATLRSVGLVDQDGATDRYRLGWKLFQYGEAAAEQFDLRHVAEPFLMKLRDVTGETAVLAVPVNGEPLVIASQESLTRRVTISVRPGNRPPPHCSAQGRVMLAFGASETVERILAGALPAHTSASITAKSALRRRLALIRERLYDSAASEILEGVNLLAMPIFGAHDALVGTIGIVGSVQFIPSEPSAKQLSLVREVAAGLSAQLGSDRYGAMSASVGKYSR